MQEVQTNSAHAFEGPMSQLFEASTEIIGINKKGIFVSEMTLS